MYCEVEIPVHLMCTQCVCDVLQRIDVCVRFICVLHSPHTHLTGPGFPSTSPVWSRFASFIPARSRGWLTEKTAVLGPPLGGAGVFFPLCPFLGHPKRAGRSMWSIGIKYSIVL